MHRELDTKVAFTIIVVLLVLVGAIYYFAFRTPSGELTPEEAGLGRPVEPGVLPDGTRLKTTPVNPSQTNQ